MSGSEQAATAVVDRQASKAAANSPSHRRSSSSLGPPPSSSTLPTILMGAGGLLVGILAAASLMALPAGQPGTATLEMVAKDQLANAIVSLGGAAPTGAVEEARQCKVPLAYLTVSADGATTASSIRIRSGMFQSPSILLTPSPRRIAIPFPAPYQTGRGMLFVEGAGQGVNVWLTPGSHYTKLEGTAAINVVWTPKPPC